MPDCQKIKKTTWNKGKQKQQQQQQIKTRCIGITPILAYWNYKATRTKIVGEAM